MSSRSSRRRRLTGLVAIGCDEISDRCGQRFLTSLVDHHSGAIVWCSAALYFHHVDHRNPRPDYGQMLCQTWADPVALEQARTSDGIAAGINSHLAGVPQSGVRRIAWSAEQRAFARATALLPSLRVGWICGSRRCASRAGVQGRSPLLLVAGDGAVAAALAPLLTTCGGGERSCWTVAASALADVILAAARVADDRDGFELARGEQR